MLRVIINSYTCCPNMGSEPGMGWNWIIHLAKYCELYVITEGEFRPQIEEWMQEHGYEAIQSLSLSCVESSGWHPLTKQGGQGRVFFFWNPVSPEVRRMCWNNGDWRFYYYYEKWQRKTADIARGIVKELHSCPVQDNSIVLHKIKGVGPDGFSLPIGEGWGGSPVPDGSLPLEGEVPVGGRGSALLLHQLNMIGFREPGYLWQVSKETGIPFVWGPVDAKEGFPMAYTEGAPIKNRLFLHVKNLITQLQLRYGSRVRKAAKQASIVLSASSNSVFAFKKYMGVDSVLMNETGCYINEEKDSDCEGSSLSTLHSSLSEDSSFKLNLLWVGKLHFRKQLSLALASLSHLKELDVTFHIVGDGDIERYKEIAVGYNINHKCVWYGNVEHQQVLEMMAHSDLLFFPSVAEGTPHVVLEAISKGLPVLCFDTCGQGDCIDSLVGCKIPLTTPLQSELEFAKKIRHFYTHPEDLSILSKDCREKRKQFSWDEQAKAMVDMYKQILEKYS